jgi:hypothetical protein
MNRKAFRSAALGAFFLTAAASPLVAQTPWIHVEVDEAGEEETRVRLNLPLSLVQVALDAAPDKIVKEGHLHLGHAEHDIDVEELRRAWQELRNAGDAELLSVEEADETVSIRRAGDLVLIDVDDRKDGDKVNIQLPVTVVDALLSGEGDELNVKDAVAELKALRGDIVRVDDGDSKVRIWIDERD